MFSLKTFCVLVTSNGELWSNVVLEEKKGNFSKDFKPEAFLGICKHNNLYNEGVFSFIILLQIW